MVVLHSRGTAPTPLRLHSLASVVQLGALAQEVLVGREQQEVARLDDHPIERSVDQAIDFVQRAAHRSPLRFEQVDDGLQSVGHFAESLNQSREEFEFHLVSLTVEKYVPRATSARR